MIKLIYNFISKIYSLFFSFYEDIFLKKNSNLKSKPLFRFKNVILSNLNYENYEKIYENKYLTKYIFPKVDINNIIKDLFIKNNLSQKISEITGLNYTINFFTAYKTITIKDLDLDKPWYANHYHIDKPYSKNMIKLFFSFEVVDLENGPMMIKDDKVYFGTLEKNEVLLFFANKYYHKASSPKKGHRFQMMLQLNPSREWKVNENIFEKQKKIEPKFPFFSYFFDNKTKLKKLSP